MLHTNFQGYQPFGSGEEDFLWFLTDMGVPASLVMWPGPFEQTFVPPSHGGLYEIWLGLAKRFLRTKRLKSVDDDDDDAGRRWRTDNGARLYYKLTYEPKGWGELKTH